MIVHPAYDPVDRVWYLDDGVTATSLAELKKILPPGTKIVGYYPHGFKFKPNYQSISSSRSHRILTPLGIHRTGKPVPPTPVLPKPVLPKTAEASSTEVRPDPAQSIVVSPEPTPKPEPKPKNSPRYDKEKILTLWAQGLTGPQIADWLGYNRWYGVVQVVCTARRQGDPRAVSRCSQKWTYRGVPPIRLDPKISRP